LGLPGAALGPPFVAGLFLSEPLDPTFPAFVHPREQLLNPALLVSIHDGSECSGKISQRIDGVELAGLFRPTNYAECVF